MNNLPVNLVVRTGNRVVHVTIPAGMSVREALDTTGLRVRAACGGTGSCGACVVNLLQGEVNAPTLAEYQKLTATEREQGQRLACQLRLKGDAEIRLNHPAPASHWKSIPPENLLPQSGKLPLLNQHIYGVAVDLGTTHIRVSLWDRKRGKRIASRCGPNPQAVFGADVLNRLEAGYSHTESVSELSRLARKAIIQAVRDILAREIGEVKPMLAEIGQVIIIGNTAMLALLTRQGSEALLNPDNWLHRVDFQPQNPVDWPLEWTMPNAKFILPEPCAGFVGSDLIADLIATDLLSGSPGSLLLDVGTNTEIALWDGQVLHVTSVPGGPAFEGGGTRFGMSADLGAIYRVKTVPDRRDFVFETLGNAEVRGFCGSGIVDAVAVLLASGVLKPSGRFVVPPGTEGYLLDSTCPRSAVTGGDIDAFQRAKAATSAAMAELLQRAGMEWADLRRLCVCGAFGHTLNISNAQAVGLLPVIDSSRIELFADATLAGCERLLLSTESDAIIANITGKIRAINLSLAAGYDDRFIEHLRLKPVPAISEK